MLEEFFFDSLRSFRNLLDLRIRYSSGIYWDRSIFNYRFIFFFWNCFVIKIYVGGIFSNL